MLRDYQKPAADFVQGHRVEFKFILGRPKLASDMISLTKEMERHDDIVLLDDEENMNNGKTFHFYQWLAKRPGAKPQFAFKVDDDVGNPSVMSEIQRELTYRCRHFLSLTIWFRC